MNLGLKNRPFVPHNMMAVQGCPVALLNFQMAPKLNALRTGLLNCLNARSRGLIQSEVRFL